MKKTYETESAPIPRKTRALQIGFSCALIALGIAIFGNAVFGTAPDKSVPIVWGLALLGSGVFFLLRSILTTHERVLSAAGKAAKQADDRVAAERRAKREAEFISWLVIIALIAVVLYCIDPITDMFESRIAVYPIYCSTSLTDTGACANDGERAGEVTKYVVHADQQLVIGLAHKAPEPIKLNNCVVADMKNWSCTVGSENDSTRLVMHDGEFAFDPMPQFPPGARYTSRWRYLLTKFTQ